MYECFSELMAESAEEPSVAHLNWERVEPLFALATSIKPGTPVFPSKMCHFIFPKLFIVVDHEATGVFEYEFYWRGMKDEWNRFREKERAIDTIRRTVESDRPLHPMYPVETKIKELCQIGYNYRVV
jgi:hypothetical protein